MPLPLAPLAGVAIRYGAIALVADMDEGLGLHRPADRGQTNTAARFRRVFRFGETAIEIDAAALGRLRIRRI